MPVACILSGSNIDPVSNTRRAITLLRQQVEVLEISTAWESRAVGSSGPNFLNLALTIQTDFNVDYLKYNVLRLIEAQLGRIRTSDKNSPRPIDLDIILFDGEVVDQNLWSRAYVAIPMAELTPDLLHPQTGRSLSAIRSEMLELYGPIHRTDLNFKDLSKV